MICLERLSFFLKDLTKSPEAAVIGHAPAQDFLYPLLFVLLIPRSRSVTRVRDNALQPDVFLFHIPREFGGKHQRLNPLWLVLFELILLALQLCEATKILIVL